MLFLLVMDSWFHVIHESYIAEKDSGLIVEITEINFFLHTTFTLEITEISSHQKRFRQITYLVIHLVKLLLSPSFCQKKSKSKFP